MPLLLLMVSKFSIVPNLNWISAYIVVGGANAITFSWVSEHVILFKMHKEYFWTYAFVLLLTSFLISVGYDLFGLYGLPVFFGVLAITALMGVESGTAAAITLSTIAAVSGNGNFKLFSMYAIASIGAIFLTKRLDKRFDFSKAALWNSLISVAMVFAMNSAFSPFELQFKSLFLAGINPFVSMVLILGALPYIEYISRIYSNMGLIELGNLGHPLVKQLLTKAPGTYFHSVMLSNMCESAAQRIGANYVLARIGPYFHDIGKIKRPEFFAENQQDSNPHDSISPMMNYLVVASHVKYGEELSRSSRLPLLVEDMIKEHHGTRMVSFFYQKALSENLKVSPDDFRYPGPKPRTKESGIVMLADSCEAAVRSLKSPSLPKIQNTVEEVVNKIYNERQLDDSSLTLRDIDQIVEEFSKVLFAMHKKRIEYPKTTREVEKVIKIAKM